MVKVTQQSVSGKMISVKNEDYVQLMGNIVVLNEPTAYTSVPAGQTLTFDIPDTKDLKTLFTYAVTDASHTYKVDLLPMSTTGLTLLTDATIGGANQISKRGTNTLNSPKARIVYTNQDATAKNVKLFVYASR